VASHCAWIDINYTAGGIAQVAETTLGNHRLIVRRTKILNDPRAKRLFPNWRHHAFVTNQTGDAVDLDADHRAHVVVELAIRDLKHGAALNHCRSGVFEANGVWLLAATLAHNLLRWVAALGLQTPGLTVAKTSDADCSRSPDASPAPPAGSPCTCPRAGPGTATSSPRSPVSEHCPQPLDSPNDNPSETGTPSRRAVARPDPGSHVAAATQQPSPTDDGGAPSTRAISRPTRLSSTASPRRTVDSG
jgi:hypothetical protein